MIGGTAMLDAESFLIGIAAGGGGGDGNLNYIETVAGTLANPWGEYTARDLFSDARSGNLTMYITADVQYGQSETTETATMMFFPISGMPTFGFTKPSTTILSLKFARIAYSATGVLNRGVAGNIDTVSETQELLEISGDTACTLTIIHHPLP